MYIGLDAASSEFFKDGAYHLDGEGKVLSPAQFTEFLAGWCAKYPILSDRGRHGRRRLGRLEAADRKARQDVQLVGDDLFVTNPAIFREGIANGIANAILIKVNQIGTLTETLEAIAMADAANYAAVISHRSGETEDTTIADLSVATTATQIKTGSLCRSDRVAKYNQLLRIEEARQRGALCWPGRFSDPPPPAKVARAATLRRPDPLDPADRAAGRCGPGQGGMRQVWQLQTPRQRSRRPRTRS